MCKYRGKEADLLVSSILGWKKTVCRVLLVKLRGLDSHDVGRAAAAEIWDSWGDPTLCVGTEGVIVPQEGGTGSAEVLQGLLEAPAAGDVATLLLSLSRCCPWPC